MAINMPLSRRHFLFGSALSVAGGAALYAGRSLWIPGTDAPSFYSCCKTDTGQYRVALVRNGQELYSFLLPGRGHSLAASHDGRYVASVARRPGNWLRVFDAAKGIELAAINAPLNDYFDGHVLYTPDNRYLLASQTEAETGQGYIGVYDAADQYRFLTKLYTDGLDPHEFALLNDGKTLVVANGGFIKTGLDDKPQNPDEMQSSLVYIDSLSGKLLDKYLPQSRYMSLRHLAVSPADEVIIGVQYHGDKYDDVPLILGHKGEKNLQVYNANTEVYANFAHYIASVAVDKSGRYAICTSPKKGAIVLWDVYQRTMLRQYQLRDVAGVYWSAPLAAFVVSNSLGQLMLIAPDNLQQDNSISYMPDRHWDNHMLAMGTV